MLDDKDPHPLRSYRLLAQIGRGGMAEVFLAVAQGQMGFNKLVVIKKTLPDLVLEPDVLVMFLDEARIAARMNHANVVQTYACGKDGDRYFLVMEYLDGQSYSRVTSRLRETMPLGLHLRVIADVLAGLDHAHELADFDGTKLGVVHRDATPHNVFITYDGAIKVVDFGIAKALNSASKTETGVVKGKVTYMSPEQARGELIDRRADVFAMGVMLWEAIAGKRMWEGLPEPTVVHELLRDAIPSIRAHAPNVDPTLAAICDRALAPKPGDRYPNALSMRRDIEQHMAKAGIFAQARDVGAFVAEGFASDRRRVAEIIESQLHDVRWTSGNETATNLPKIEPAKSAPSGPSSVTAAPASPTRPSATFPPVGTNEGEASRLVPTHSGTSLHLQKPEERPRSPTFTMALALIALVAGAFLAFGLLGKRSPTEAPAASAPPASPSQKAPPPQEASRVKLTIRVTPKEAKVYLGGALLSTGPFEGLVAQSTEPTIVRVEAEGYRTKEDRVILTADLVMSLDLLPAEDPAQSAARSADKPSPNKLPSPAPKPEPEPSQKRPPPRRDIDPDSPYKNP